MVNFMETFWDLPSFIVFYFLAVIQIQNNLGVIRGFFTNQPVPNTDSLEYTISVLFFFKLRYQYN